MSAETIDIKPHIGEDLRRAREEAGLSFAQVSETLRIQGPFLQAIETLDKASLPSIGYVLGYVRAYAMHVGLDGKEAVERYKIDSEVPENLGMRDAPHFVPQRHIRLPKGFFAATTIISCAAVLALWYGSHTNANSAGLGPDTRLNIPEGGAPVAVSIDPDLMTFKATAPTWVEIRDSKRQKIISRILVTGESWQTDVDSGVSLSARDSGALELYIGGEFIGRLGRKGIPMTEVPMPAVPREFAADALKAAEDAKLADITAETETETETPALRRSDPAPQ